MTAVRPARRRPAGYGGEQDEELTELHKRFNALEEEAKVTHDNVKAATMPAGSGASAASTARRPSVAPGTASTVGESSATTQSGASTARRARKDITPELKKLDEQIISLRRRHDELAHTNLMKRRQLDDMANRLRELSNEAKRPTSDNPIVKEIKTLERRLERAVARYEDAQEVRKTYEQIVRRLKDERVSFANQLQAAEATLKAKEADYEQLLLMSHDANHSKEMAKQELTKFEAIVGEERKAREKELQERRALVARKHEMSAELERREKARREAAREAEHAEEARRAAPGASQVTEADIEEEQAKIAAYEAAFREIKEATSVSDVNEVIQKFIAQEETHKSLVAMTEESQRKIDALAEQKRQLQERVETLSYAAQSDVASLERVPQAIVDPLAPSATAEEQLRAERQRHKYERMSRLLIDVKAGIGHLTENLEAVGLPGENAVPLTDDSLVDVLLQNERRLALVLGAVRAEEEALARDGVDLDGELHKSAMLREPVVENNVRIKDPVAADEPASEEEYEEDLEDDIVDRDTLKKASMAIVDKVAKKSKKKHKQTKNP